MPVQLYKERGTTRVAVRPIDPEPVKDGVHVEQGCVEPVPLVAVRSAEHLVDSVLAPLAAALKPLPT
jgi:hypothetical protein